MFSKALGFFSKKSASNGEETPPPEAPQTTAAPAEAIPSARLAATAEELCELSDSMTHEELRDHLTKLYRRHNRATSSLNRELGSEAERMLDAIVEVRHTYLE